VYLDECGFAPSQPVTYTWVRTRERKRVPYENPEGRRVNALAALAKGGDVPALYWVAKPGSLRAEHLIAFLTDLPPAPVPTVIVLDNGSIHRSRATHAARSDLWRRGVYLYFLPPYCPDLNAIEPAFRAIKHYQMPERRYASLPALLDAVHTAFTTYEEALITKSAHQPGRVA
jgi:putative transposase